MISAGCASTSPPSGPVSTSAGCWEGLVSAGGGCPECLPFPPPSPSSRVRPALEAAAFVSRGAGSSTRPSLAPFVLLRLCRWENQMRPGGGRNLLSAGSPLLRTPRAAPRPSAPSEAAPEGGLSARAPAPGRRGVDGAPPGTPPRARARLLAGTLCSAGARERSQPEPEDPSPAPSGSPPYPRLNPPPRLPPGTTGGNSMRPLPGPPAGLAISYWPARQK